MTNTERLHKQAAKQSKYGATMYVVYVPDQGADVYDAEQMAIYKSLVFVDAVYVGGIKVADQVAA